MLGPDRECFLLCSIGHLSPGDPTLQKGHPHFPAHSYSRPWMCLLLCVWHCPPACPQLLSPCPVAFSWNTCLIPASPGDLRSNTAAPGHTSIHAGILTVAPCIVSITFSTKHHILQSYNYIYSVSYLSSAGEGAHRTESTPHSLETGRERE